MKVLVRRLWLSILVTTVIFYGAAASFAQGGQEYTDETGKLAIKEAPIEASDKEEKPIRIEDLQTPEISIDRDKIKGCEPTGSPEIKDADPKLSPPQDTSFNQMLTEELFHQLMPEQQIDFAITECLPTNYSWMSIPPGHEYLGQWPNHTVGMLLFDTPTGTSRCSAAVVGRRLVLTAGHCVSDGAGGWYSNFRFYPATIVTNPLNPSNSWTYETAVTFKVYLETGAWCRDVAFLVMRSKSGQQIGDVYGWLGFTANQPTAGQTWYIWGYPAYLGDLLLINLSPYYQRANLGCEPFDILVSSNHNKGSSGGPWALVIDNTYYANSVNSAIAPACTLPDMSTALFAPYFDDSVWNAFLAYNN
jgi:hypothetical protein